jgi:dihydroorotate dehydrogenase subfamily 2
MYDSLIKPILFRCDPERMHDVFVGIGGFLGAVPGGTSLVRAFCGYGHPSLRTEVCGIPFENPIGLAAGFDKDVRLTNVMPAVGFGFMEVGSVTHYPYGGNSGRRLVRLPADRSIIVHYGLKNIGADAVRKKLPRFLPFRIPTGLNIAKTNREDIKGTRSVDDYVATYRMLAPYFSYATLNISCPNAQDGLLFQDPRMLNDLLAAFSGERKYGPIFLKLSVDLTEREVDDIIGVVEKYAFVDGFVVGNLVKRREALALRSSPERLALLPQGGISGDPIRDLSTNMIRRIYRVTKGKYAIIGLGGVFTAEDAYEKITAGASLVEMVTGLIYRGPTVVKEINRSLVDLLARDGYAHIADAVGVAAGR